MSIWSPLRSATSIRLLVLHPAKTGDRDRLDASLHEVSLDDKGVEYEAISYTWGDEQNQQTIRIVGQEPLIRENLWRFLRRLTGSQDRLLWVDALSINQNDTQEKSQQVAMIGRIFQRATGVVAWLGEHADGSDKLLKRLATCGTSLNELQQPSEISGVGAGVQEGASHTERLIEGEQEARLKLWKAFLNRPWFGRTWIIQEVVLAKSLTLHCGSDALRWEQLPPCEKLETFDEMHYLLNGRLDVSYQKCEFRFRELQDSRRRQQMRVPAWKKDEYRDVSSLLRWYTDLSNTIGHLAMTFSAWNCFDRRDKIYALISLEDLLPEQQAIEPDYSLSIEDTFLSVFRQRCGDVWRSRVAQRNALADPEEGVATFASTLADALGLEDRRLVLSLLQRDIIAGQDGFAWMSAIKSFRKRIAAGTSVTDAGLIHSSQQPEKL